MRVGGQVLGCPFPSGNLQTVWRCKGDGNMVPPYQVHELTLVNPKGQRCLNR